MVQSLEASGLKPGDWAAFPGGGGGVGIQGIQLAKAMGIRPIAIDTGSEKRDLCLEMGAEVFIDFRTVESAAEEVVKAADGEGAHGVFVTAPQAYRDAIACVGTRVGAKVMCIGLREYKTIILLRSGYVVAANDIFDSSSRHRHARRRPCKVCPTELHNLWHGSGIVDGYGKGTSFCKSCTLSSRSERHQTSDTRHYN